MLSAGNDKAFIFKSQLDQFGAIPQLRLHVVRHPARLRAPHRGSFVGHGTIMAGGTAAFGKIGGTQGMLMTYLKPIEQGLDVKFTAVCTKDVSMF
jgi:hypothetical protein